MPKTPPSDAARTRYEELVEFAESRGALRAQMFGSPSLRFENGKHFACLSGENMIFKVTDAALREELLALPGARNFDPSGSRPMREWVQLPPEHAARYEEVAAAVLAAGPSA
ncbi:MAG: hypothetical protein Q4G64_02335 [bacterium]|nr:hypothetical protein [bacterium]